MSKRSTKLLPTNSMTASGMSKNKNDAAELNRSSHTVQDIYTSACMSNMRRSSCNSHSTTSTAGSSTPLILADTSTSGSTPGSSIAAAITRTASNNDTAMDFRSMKPMGALRRSRSGDSVQTWTGFGGVGGGGRRERSGSADSGGSFDFITDLLPGKKVDSTAADGESPLNNVGGLQQEAEAARKAPRRGRRRPGASSPNDPTAATIDTGAFSDTKRRHSFDNLLALPGLRSVVAMADSRKSNASKGLSDELVCINPKKVSKQIVHVGKQMKTSNTQAASMVLADDDDFKALQKRLRETGAVTITGVDQFLTASLRQQVLEAELSRDTERLRRMSGGVHGTRPPIPRDVSIEMLDVGGGVTNLIKASSGGSKASLMADSVWGLKSFADMALSSLDSERCTKVSRGKLRRWNLIDSTTESGNVSPFVSFPSRDMQANVIVHSLRDAQSGLFVLVTVEGGAFLGKSRLVAECIHTETETLSRQSQKHPLTVLESFRTSLDSHTAYFSFRQITLMALQQCASRIGVSSRPKEDGVTEIYSPESDGTWDLDILVEAGLLTETDRAMIGLIVPSVMDQEYVGLLQGKSPSVLVKSAASTILKLFNQIQPLCLVLDSDGEGTLDKSSLELLSYLIQVAPERCPKMCIFLLSRDQVSLASSPAAAHRDIRSVRLQPLPIDETEQHIKTMLGIVDKGTDIHRTLVSTIYEKTGGCPLFAERLVSWALAKNLFAYDSDVDCIILRPPETHSWNEAEEFDMSGLLPSDLIDCVLQAFDCLDQKLWDTLRIACCLGPSFDPEEYLALDRNIGFMSRIQELATTHGVFERTSTGRYRWKQQILFLSIQSIILTEEKREIHESILRTFGAYDENADPALLARHSAYAGNFEEAVALYVEAGTRSEEKFHFGEAENFFAQAMESQKHIGSTSSGGGGGSAAIKKSLIPKIKRGDCLRELAMYDESEKLLTECLYAVRDSDNNDEVLQVLAALATLKQATSCYQEARALYQDALTIARATEGSHSNIWLARHISRFGEILRKSGEFKAAEKMHREALQLRLKAKREGKCTDLELAVSYTQLGCTNFSLQRYDESSDQHRLALEIRVRTLDFESPLCSESLNYCGECLNAMGRGYAGIPFCVHAVHIRRKAFGPNHPAYAHALSVLAKCFRSVGRSCDAIRLMEECNEICEVAFSSHHANLIPNHIAYGEALQSVGRHANALTAFERAASIHKHNFSDGQHQKQLEKIEESIKDVKQQSATTRKNSGRRRTLPYRAASMCLSDDSSSEDEGVETSTSDRNLGRMRSHSLRDLGPACQRDGYSVIPSIDVDSDATPVIVCTDVGRRFNDDSNLVLLRGMTEAKLLQPIAVVINLYPQVDRACIARGALDSLGLGDVPVGIGGVAGGHDTDDLAVYETCYARNCTCIEHRGVDLMVRSLKSAPDLSVKILCIANLSDVAQLLRDEPDLCVDKVKEIVMLGSLQPLETDADLVVPDFSAASEDGPCDEEAAVFVYQRCQELNIPTFTVADHVSDRVIMTYPDICQSSHFIATGALHRLNEKMEKGDVRNGKEPFYIDLHSAMTMLSSADSYRPLRFSWKMKEVRGIQHCVAGSSSSETAVVDVPALEEELKILYRLGFQSALPIQARRRKRSSDRLKELAATPH